MWIESDESERMGGIRESVTVLTTIQHIFEKDIDNSTQGFLKKLCLPWKELRPVIVGPFRAGEVSPPPLFSLRGRLSGG